MEATDGRCPDRIADWLASNIGLRVSYASWYVRDAVPGAPVDGGWFLHKAQEWPGFGWRVPWTADRKPTLPEALGALAGAGDWRAARVAA